MAMDTETLRLVPERPARQSLAVERRLLVQVKISETEKAHMVSLARAQGGLGHMTLDVGGKLSFGIQMRRNAGTASQR